MQRDPNDWTPTPIAVLLTVLTLSGCGLGSAIIAGSGGDSSGGSLNAVTVASALRVTNALDDGARPVTSPATIRFDLTDQEGDLAQVVLSFATRNSQGQLTAFDEITQDASQPPVNLSALATNHGPHAVLWDFETDLGSESFRQGVVLRLEVVNGIGPMDAEGIEVGNDSPEIATQASRPGFADAGLPVGEAAGVVLLTFGASDSSSDSVDVLVEFAIADGLDILGGEMPPETAFVSATVAGQFPPLTVSSDPEQPTEFAFVWNVEVDLPGEEHKVVMRLTPHDELASKPGTILSVGAAILTEPFRVDNNAPPRVLAEFDDLTVNPDSRFGIPILLDVSDDEADAVEVLVQWTYEGEPFPDLSALDVEDLREALADPAERERLRLAYELPQYLEGVPVPPVSGDPSELGTPELASNRGGFESTDSLVGRRLELMRLPGLPTAARAGWSAATDLRGPVAAVPRGDGDRAWILDAGASGWRLREINLASGSELGTLATGLGAPMAMDGDEDGLFIASYTDHWIVEQVDPSLGSQTPWLLAEDPQDGSVASGVPGGLASLGEHAVLLTVGGALLSIRHGPAVSATLGTVVDAGSGVLQDAADIEPDPIRDGRVYVADRGRGRVLWVELDTRRHGVVPTGGVGMGAPRSLAMEGHGSILLVATDELPSKLWTLHLGVEASASSVVERGELPGSAAGLAVGPDGLRLAALFDVNDLALAGGIEQSREVAGYDASRRELRLDAPLDPAPTAGVLAKRWWRIRLSGSSVAAHPSGTRATFVWDSTRLPRSGDVLVRVLGIDTDAGPVQASVVSRPVSIPLDGSDQAIYNAVQTAVFPGQVLLGDWDGNGAADVVGFEQFDHLRLFLQAGRQLSPGWSEVPGISILGGRAVGADMDGNGLQDLVFSDARFGLAAPQVRIFLQSAPGVFPDDSMPDHVLGSPGSPEVEVGDFDCDGRLDVAAIDTTNDLLVLWRQATPGRFGENGDPSSPLVVGSFAAQTLDAADVDGDGRLDLVAAGTSAGYPRGIVAVFLQHDPAVFGSRAGPGPSFLVGGTSSTLDLVASRAVDIDVDGLVDVVGVTEEFVLVFLQGADGSLGLDGNAAVPNIAFEHREASALLELEDYDGNGRPDVLLRDASNPASAVVFLQALDGTFSQGQELVGPSYVANASVTSAVADDVDGDGDLDVAMSFDDVIGLGAVLYFEQLSPGDVSSNHLLAVGLAPFQAGSPAPPFNRPGAFAVVDTDHDGRLDVVTSNEGGRSVTIFRQRRTGATESTPGLVVGNPSESSFGPVFSVGPPAPTEIQVVDLDGNGLEDLVVANSIDGRLDVYRQDAAWVFGAGNPQTPNQSVSLPDARDLQVVDIDADGNLDLVGLGTSGVETFLGDGSGAFGPGFVSLTTGYSESFAVADVNADGLPDVLSSVVHLQQPGGGFTGVPDAMLGGISTLHAISLADVDGDGHRDLIVGSYPSGGGGTWEVGVFLARGGGAFGVSAGATVLPDRAFNIVHPIASLDLADLDGDGDLDLVVSGGDFGGKLSIHEQIDPLDFRMRPGLLSGLQSAAGCSLVDFDQDGSQDVLYLDRQFPDDPDATCAYTVRVFFGSR